MQPKIRKQINNRVRVLLIKFRIQIKNYEYPRDWTNKVEKKRNVRKSIPQYHIRVEIKLVGQWNMKHHDMK